MQNNENAIWPGWETVRLIGRGSFGTVYEIQRDVFGEIEKAALKVISIPQNASDIEEMYSDGYDEESVTSTLHTHLKSIVAEYSLMRKMNGSSNIVNCDDVRYVQHDDGIGWDIYIKMELLTPLAKALPATVSEVQVMKIARDMCAALELCSKHNIIHRDIKPQNIFVSATGDYKLGDFGIAKTVEKTMGGTKIGTYKYMAPEVYNNQPYGMGADIYSLGLVLYWLLNERRMPFMPLPPEILRAGMDEESRYRRFSGEKIPAPKNGSAELKRIVLKACAFAPKDRYQTAREMWDDIAQLAGGHTEKFAPDPEPSPDPIVPDDFNDDKTVGPVFNHVPAVDTEDLEKTVGPMFAAENQKVAENLDVHQTLQFLHDDNPAGKVIAVQVGNDTMRVLIPQQFENGQTLYYEGMGMKSAYSEARGNLYLTVYIAPAPVQVNVNPALKRKKTGFIAAVLACVLLIGGVVFGMSLGNKSSEDIPETATDDQVVSTRWEQNIMMQDSTTGVDQAREILGSEVTDGEIVAYCAQHPVLGSDIPRSQIMSVTFLDSAAFAPSSSWDVSAGQNGTVIAWVVSNGDFYDLYIAGEGGVNGALVTPHMFFMYINLQEIHFNGNFHTENSTDMVGMFYYCISLEKVDVSSLDTSAVLNMRYMFHECRNLESLDVSGFDTLSVTDMGYMFNGCMSLQELDISVLDTSSVTSMKNMFSGCSGLQKLDMSAFDTSSVVDMAHMFSFCSSLKSLDVSSFDTSSVTDMASMFDGCVNLDALDVSGFDTSSVQWMTWMFSQCSNLKDLDVGDFDTSSVTNMGGMFYGCSGLELLNVRNFDTASVTDMFWMFSNCSKLKTLDLNSFDTSSVTNMQQMFLGCSDLETLDVSNFDTSSVMYMDYMFSECPSLQSLDVSHFDISGADSKEGFYIANGVVRYEGY